MTSFPKPASSFTVNANQSAAAVISFDDVGDFARAEKGLIATIDGGQVTAGENGEHVVWDVARHAFIERGSDAPDSVHPGLWRQAQLNNIHGLFEVAENVWQVRGYDLANITFMAGPDGWLVIDPLTNAPAAAASLDLVNRTVGERPVTSVIYTHSHVDHFGGIHGVTSQEEVDAGNVRIVAPEGFLREVVNEFSIAGPIMARRSVYQFGPMIPPGPRGHVDSGLGAGIGFWQSGLIAPTTEVATTGEEMDLSGIRVIFQNTPDAEAPAEMNFFFPDKRLLCMAENCTHTLHNLYPIRGAQTRDALAWSKYIQEAADLWGADTDTMFASHHWPRFGQDDVLAFLEMQRDVYRWMHDQTMRLANNGYVPTEIAEELSLPAAFSESHVQGYYGTVSHNAKSVYTKYLGWYDGNPANLNPHPPVESASRYVEMMGGAGQVLAGARNAFADGDYRWVAQVVNHVVFADPSNVEARHLQADALEQMGYQAESSTWRNAYLMGAQELRTGSPTVARAATRDTAASMTVEQLMDTLGVRFNPVLFAHERATVNVHFTDVDEHHVMAVSRSALVHLPLRIADEADATLRVDRASLLRLAGAPELPAGLETDGDRELVAQLLAAFELPSVVALIEP